MDYRLQPTLEAVESTKYADWKWSCYTNRHGVPGMYIRLQYEGQHHIISVHNCPQPPDQEKLAEVIRGISHLDPNRTWLYENRTGCPGFSTTAWSQVSLHGSIHHALMISRSHEFVKLQ